MNNKIDEYLSNGGLFNPELMDHDELRNLIINIRHEIKILQRYEELVRYIANDYHELSYEKAQWQRDDWKKRCRKLIEEDFNNV